METAQQGLGHYGGRPVAQNDAASFFMFQSKYIAKCIHVRPRFRFITLGKDYDVITLISSRTPPEIVIVADDGKYRKFVARWFEVRERE